MTVAASIRAQRDPQQRGFPISQGGWGGWIGDPSAIPPPSAFNYGTAGVIINERTVMSLMVVSSCIRVLGDTVAGLEPRVFRMKGTRPTPERDKEVDPPPVITEPYAEMDRQDGDFRRVASLGLNGNLLIRIVDRDGKGNPCQTEVLNPSLVKVEIIEGRKVYKLGAGGTIIPPDTLIHRPWIALPGGVVGLNPIEIGINGFGIPIAAEQYAQRYFAQGLHPSGILSVEKPLRPGDAKRVEEELFTKHGGLAQAHTPIVLDSAAKWQQISITPETAQLLQSRAFSRGEIAGFYGVPGFLLNDMPQGQGGPWGKGLQETIMGFAIFALAGYTERLDRVDTALLPAGYYAYRNIKELFKTNDQVRGTYISMLRACSVATPNDGREIAGLQPSDEPGSDSLFAPMNSAHSDFLAEGGEGPEEGLPMSQNPKGVPNGSGSGGVPANEPEGGSK